MAGCVARLDCSSWRLLVLATARHAFESTVKISPRFQKGRRHASLAGCIMCPMDTWLPCQQEALVTALQPAPR